MTQCQKIIDKISVNLFRDGVSFFIPYLAVYLFGWVLNLKISIILSIFTVLHVGFCLLFLLFCLKRISSFQVFDVLFWLLIFLLLFLPGAYLEYPSDPWEHVRRIFSWTSATTIGEHDLRGKFSYFFFWSFLRFIPLLSRREALDLLSACSQLLLAYQLYLFARTLRFSKWSAYVHVIAFFCIFGTSSFGVRYYALSSTIIAYAAYFRALTVLIELFSGQSSRWREIAALFFLIAFNHQQEVILLFCSGTVIFLTTAYLQTDSKILRKRIRYLFLFVCVLSILASTVALQVFPELRGNLGRQYISSFGTFLIFNSKLRIISTLGVSGIVACVVSLFWVRRQPLLSLLTLAPVFFLLFPPIVLLACQLFDKNVPVYRLLFAMPVSFILVCVVEEGWILLIKFFKWRRGESCRYLVALGVVLLLTAKPSSPWYGRVFFQLHIPEPSRTFVVADQAAAWLQEHQVFKNNCYLLADEPTNFVIISHLGLEKWVDRRRPWIRRSSLRDEESLLLFLQSSGRPVCGVLVPEIEKFPPSGHSQMAVLTSHWKDQAGDLRWYLSEDLIKATKLLPTHGWKKHQVSPYYVYYEKPTTQGISNDHLPLSE